MDYLIAQDLIRTEGPASDLVREGGLRGFAPFETPADPTARPLLRLSLGEPLSSEQFGNYRELDRFEFEEKRADCSFGRYDDPILFT